MDDTFYLTGAVLAVAAVIGLLANRARQPLIVGYIAVGILVGPSVLGWVEGAEPLELFAEIGIAILLFLVGLKLDLHLVRTTGRVAVMTGLGQVVFTSVVGFVLAVLLGMETVTALYVAIALTFFSTIIIVKLLSDKRELDELPGRIALGFLNAISRVLADSLRRWRFRGRIAVTVHNEADAQRLSRDVEAARFDLVLNPFDDAAQKAALALMPRRTG